MTLPDSRAGWAGVRVVVHGFWADGAAAADNLLFLGAEVTVLAEEAPSGPDDPYAERADLLRALGADIRLGPGATRTLPSACDLVVSAPDGDQEGPLEEQADARGIPVWSAHELAWRLREPDAPPWLVIAAPHEAAHTAEIAAHMVERISVAAGLRGRAAVVNGALPPIVEIVMDPDQPDIVAAALGARQLARSSSVRAESAVVLAGGDPALGQAFEGVRLACVYNVADPSTEELVQEADVVEGARAIGLTLGTPAVSMLGTVDDLLVDRAFIAERRTSAADLASFSDLWHPAANDQPDPTPEVLLAALAAAALTRAHGLSQAAVRDGLRAWGHVDSSDDE